jgi:NAD-dependent SIR2 family protein deacetylase
MAGPFVRPGQTIIESSWRSNVFTCRNQSCEAQWEQSDVVIKNEGQGLLFRCPMCGARNYVERFDGEDGSVLYEQLEGRPDVGPMAE